MASLMALAYYGSKGTGNDGMERGRVLHTLAVWKREKARKGVFGGKQTI